MTTKAEYNTNFTTVYAFIEKYEAEAAQKNYLYYTKNNICFMQNAPMFEQFFII